MHCVVRVVMYAWQQQHWLIDYVASPLLCLDAWLSTLKHVQALLHLQTHVHTAAVATPVPLYLHSQRSQVFQQVGLSVAELAGQASSATAHCRRLCCNCSRHNCCLLLQRADGSCVLLVQCCNLLLLLRLQGRELLLLCGLQGLQMRTVCSTVRLKPAGTE
jgi:hypothetical protein